MRIFLLFCISTEQEHKPCFFSLGFLFLLGFFFLAAVMVLSVACFVGVVFLFLIFFSPQL